MTGTAKIPDQMRRQGRYRATNSDRAALVSLLEKGPPVARLSAGSSPQPQVEDGYLIALAKQGHHEAYDHIVRRYYGFVRLKASGSTSKRFLGNPPVEWRTGGVLETSS